MIDLSFVEVDKKNYKTAVKFQKEFFPYEDGEIDILESVGLRAKTYKHLKYYLIKNNRKVIGVTGFYSYDIYPDTAWLAWSGFIKKYATIDIKQLMLSFIKDIAAKIGYSSLRVYSDEIADKEDNLAYEKFGMIKEEYLNEKNKYYSIGKTFIYSISLTNEKVKLWKDKCLYLEAHEQRNKEKEDKPIKIDLDKVKLVPVVKSNSTQAIKIQQSIFPLENGKEDILESLKKVKLNYDYLKYYLIAYEEKFIGICGLYSYKEYPSDAWMAWFGVLPKYRQNGIGHKSISILIDEAKQNKFKALRVYTDSNLNHSACRLYEKTFDTKEKYLNEKNKYYSVGDTLIFSKSLTNKPVKLWNDKCLFLEEHENRNNNNALKFVPLNKNNLDLAAYVQYQIFNDSHSCGYLDYKDEVSKKSKTLPLDFLVYYKKSPVGVIGLYEIEGSDDIWLNWFGVIDKYRKHGFGTQMLLFALETAKNMGKKTFRLFTYSVWHAKAQGIYKRTMKIEEDYTNKDDSQYCINQGKPKIFSISLKDSELKKWNNKFIDLESEKKLHMYSIQQMVKDGIFEKFNNVNKTLKKS